MRTCFRRVLPLLLLLVLPGVVQAQCTFTTNNGTLTVTGYAGLAGDLIIPSSTNGLPVTGVAPWAFNYYTSLTSVTIPDSVTNIGSYAFGDCPNLTTITVDGHNS